MQVEGNVNHSLILCKNVIWEMVTLYKSRTRNTQSLKRNRLIYWTRSRCVQQNTINKRTHTIIFGVHLRPYAGQRPSLPQLHGAHRHISVSFPRKLRAAVRLSIIFKFIKYFGIGCERFFMQQPMIYLLTGRSNH